VKVAVGGSDLGGFTGYAVLEDGSVVAWGGNDEGQLGSGASGADVALGKYPKPALTPVKVTGLTNVIGIAAGEKHAVALRRDGTVWAWGRRDDGALGGGEVKPAGSLRVLSAMAPVRVPGLEGITQIAAGGSHGLALTRDGRVMSWGRNHSGELGLGTRATGWTPAVIPGLDHVVTIAAGSGVSGAVREDGTVWMWGSNASAMIGNGERPEAPDAPGGRILVPLQVTGITTAKQLAIGGGNVAALLADGTLRMWGHNGYGESGTGSPDAYSLRPVKTALTNVVAVYLGNMRSNAVRADGTFWFWGFPYTPGAGALGKTWKVPTRLDLP
jgi:alpha-tubulin suppressor-like RCC1 family protein